MRKLFAVIPGLLVLCALGLIVFFGYAFIRGGKIPADLPTKPWIEHSFYTDRLALDVPWQLDAESLPSADGRMDHSRKNGLEVVISVSPPNRTASLDETVDLISESIKSTPGIKIISENRQEESVLGGRAIALYMTCRDRWMRKTDVRIICFVMEDRLYQIHCNSPTGDPTGGAIWERMKNSVRRVKNTSEPGAVMIPSNGIPMPKGMKRR